MRLACSLLLVTLALAAPALASPPDPNLSTIPASIALVGHRGGVPDPAGTFVVNVRDRLNNAYPGITVVCDLSACTDLRIASQQPYPGLTVDCATKRVSAVSDVNGNAHFCIVGGAVNSGGAPGAGAAAMIVFGNGIRFGAVSVAAYDQTGFDGLKANDLAAWVGDAMAGLTVARSDYDGNGSLGVNDLSLWVARFLSAASDEGAASLPGGVCP